MKLYYENFNLDYFGIVNKTISNFSDYHFGKCENEIINEIEMKIPIGIEYCSGGGYYIKSDNLSKMLDKMSNFNLIIFEDVCIGKTLSEFNIFPQNKDVKNSGFFW